MKKFKHWISIVEGWSVCKLRMSEWWNLQNKTWSSPLLCRLLMDLQLCYSYSYLLLLIICRLLVVPPNNSGCVHSFQGGGFEYPSLVDTPMSCVSYRGWNAPTPISGFSPQALLVCFVFPTQWRLKHLLCWWVGVWLCIGMCVCVCVHMYPYWLCWLRYVCCGLSELLSQHILRLREEVGMTSWVICM